VDTRSRGNAAEAAVLAAFATRGYRVLVPFGDAHPYDLAVHASGAFIRVQCKAGWQERGCILFNCRSTDHGRGPLPYIGRADVVGVHFAPLDTVYVVPVDAVGSHEGRLRLVPALNNQRRLTRPAADFEIDRWTPEALAATAMAA
jgi:hypothetical protein